jgi:hypothetical protein
MGGGGAVPYHKCSPLSLYFIKCIQGYSKFSIGVSVAYNFQTGYNKIKLLTECGSVTQKVLLHILESVLQNAKQLEHARLL